MKRTIYEMPVYMHPHFVKLAEENGLLITQFKATGEFAEIQVTHDKQQDYILRFIEQEVGNTFSDNELAQTG